MKHAVILAAGLGTKLWPYAQIRSKCMVPISNKPIIAHTVQALCELGFAHIAIVANRFSEEIAALFAHNPAVEILLDEKPQGTAFSLYRAREAVGDNPFLALYGDTLVQKEDIARLMKAAESGSNAALVAPIASRSSDYIGCTLQDGAVAEIWGHSREESTHFFGGFALHSRIFPQLATTSKRFRNIEVGMMPQLEAYLENTLEALLPTEKLLAVEAKQPVFDVDKPWHILEAGFAINRLRCGALTENILAEGAQIHPTAVLGGFVQLGKNSRIGPNTIIEGNIIVGDNTEITNGAIVQGDVVIGDGCKVRNACFISQGSTVGDECIVSHAAELDGMILRRVYLYHYMEFYGIIGENTDLGAATVCGSLRFDDGETQHRTKGRREYPSDFSNATFLGDYCRTGVNAIFMPGVKVGVYSVVGAGVLLNRDVPDNTMVYAEQTLKERPWGSDMYGW